MEPASSGQGFRELNPFEFMRHVEMHLTLHPIRRQELAVLAVHQGVAPAAAPRLMAVGLICFRIWMLIQAFGSR